MGKNSEAFLKLEFQFLIRLGPFLDSRFRGNDPSRRQARRAKSNKSVKNASQNCQANDPLPSGIPAGQFLAGDGCHGVEPSWVVVEAGY